MVFRAVGAAALFVLAASSAVAQSFDPGMGGPGGPGMPGPGMGGPAMTGPGWAPVSTSADPLLGSGVSTLSGNGGGSRFWIEAGYQAGFVSNLPTPAILATRGGTFGVQGAAGVSNALGGGSADFNTLHGGRFSAGLWLDSNRAYGIEASAFFLSEGSTSSSTGGGGVLARPFFDTSIQGQNVRILNLPGQVSGSITSSATSEFWGADLGPIVRVIETEMITLDQLFYFRYLNLEESMVVSDTVSPVGGAVTFRGQAIRGPGSAVSVRDSASTTNHFYGGGVGARLSITPGRFSASVTGKIAVGGTTESLVLDGSTTLSGAGANQSAAGGLLVPGASNGRYSQSKLTYVPEVGVKLGFQITQNFGVYVGYNFLYMSQVSRPGGNFATSVNPTQLPSSQNFGVPFGPNPAPVQLMSSDFFMHSVGVGGNVKF